MKKIILSTSCLLFPANAAFADTLQYADITVSHTTLFVALIALISGLTGCYTVYKIYQSEGKDPDYTWLGAGTAMMLGSILLALALVMCFIENTDEYKGREVIEMETVGTLKRD